LDEFGRNYESVVPLGVTGAYDEALKSYQEAIKVAPKNPSIYFTLARLEVSNKNTKEARAYLDKACLSKRLQPKLCSSVAD